MSNDELLTYMKERFDNQDKKIDEIIAIVKPIVEWKNKVQWTFEAMRYLVSGGGLAGAISLIWYIFKLLTSK